MNASGSSSLSDDEPQQSDAGARCRAFWPKFTVATAKRAPEDIRKQVLAAIPESLRSEIRSAPTFGWQDARVFFDLTEAIATLPEPVAVAFWRYSLRNSILQPVIRTLVDGGMAVFGRSPQALYRRTPRAWSLVSQNCGVMTVEDVPGREASVLRLVDVPPMARSHDGIPLLLAGGLRGQADYCMREAHVEVRLANYRTWGELEFHVHW